MAILAFECANFTLSLALMTNRHTVFFDDFQELRGQDQVLLPKIEGLLDKADLSFQDLDLIVTTTGPGSFTGIRLALAEASVSQRVCLLNVLILLPLPSRAI